MIPSKIELLSPAGSMKALVAAVENGADAVYLGGQAFSARKHAANFGLEELREACDYAHLRGAKIYLTMNTLLLQEELTPALRFIEEAAQRGIDAVIIQDLGLLSLIRRHFPHLPVHGSTQMSIHNSQGVNQLGDWGLQRVVLGRELTLEEIKTIRERSAIEIEVFCHGAICFSYSGQCYFSSMIGGRSGNRGDCAQACRQAYQVATKNFDDEEYRLTGKEAQYHLSPKDLYTLDLVPELIKTGVHALKVEGRMKSPEYVAAATRAYRQAIDDYYSCRPQDTNQAGKELAQIFTRGFSSAYLVNSAGSDLLNPVSPKNQGVLIGRVTQVTADRYSFTVLLERELALNDGIELRQGIGPGLGLKVDRMEIKGEGVKTAPAGEKVEIFPWNRELLKGIKSGQSAYKTRDDGLMRSLEESHYRNLRKVKVFGKVTVEDGQCLHFSLWDEDGSTVAVTSELVAQKAQKQPLARELLLEKLGRMGDTVFSLETLETEISGAPILPVSELNRVRRKATEMLVELRMKRDPQSRRADGGAATWGGPYPIPLNKGGQGVVSRTPCLSVRVDTLEKGRAALEGGANRVYVGGESYFPNRPFRKEELEAFLKGAPQAVEVIVATPRIVDEEELEAWKKRFAEWQELGIRSLLIGNMGLWHLSREFNFKRYADFSFNQINAAALHHLASDGALQATLSPELTLSQVGTLAEHSPIPLEVLVHGNFSLFTTRRCMISAVYEGTSKGSCSDPCKKLEIAAQDGTGAIFPLRGDSRCRGYLFNSAELNALELLPKLVEIGIGSVRLNLELNTSEEVRALVQVYREGLDRFLNGEKGLSDLKKQIAMQRQGFTKGHFFRGLEISSKSF